MTSFQNKTALFKFFSVIEKPTFFNKLFFLTSVFTSFCPPLLSDKVAVCFLGWGIHFLIVWKIIHPTVIPCLHNIDWKPDLLGWGNKILFFFGGGGTWGEGIKILRFFQEEGPEDTEDLVKASYLFICYNLYCK